MKIPAAYRALSIGALTTLLCVGCGSRSATESAINSSSSPLPQSTQPNAASAEPTILADSPYGPTLLVMPTPPDPCDQDDTEGWLDKSQEWLFERTCGTAAWFDGFFGNERYNDSTGQTHGRVGLSGSWDQRDGFDQKLRFRGTYALPAMQNRGQLMFGRGDAEELIEERTTQWDTIPGNFSNIEDDSFLVGLGYSGKRKRGFKVSIGAKIRAPPEPYIKLRYRKHWAVTQTTLLGIRPIVYWKTEEKLGATLHVDIDQMLNDHMMIRWANYSNVAQSEEVRGVEWESSLFLFQALTDRKAVTYRALVLGSTDAPEPLTNYGFELRYRKRMFREWLFLEILSSITWPKEFIEEERDANLGIGIGFELYFGPVPDKQMY